MLHNMRLHIVSLPNTSTTRDYSWSPYTQKIRNFSKMMIELGHETFIYGGPLNDAICTEHIECISLSEQKQHFPERFPDFDPSSDGRSLFARRVIREIEQRCFPGDILCITEGQVQMSIAAALPQLLPIEIGVGYEATFTDRRAFESYAWMHAVYGYTQGALAGIGNFLDTVIPNAYDIDDFPPGNHSGDYLVYVGRLHLRKGIEVACDVAMESGRTLIVCGEGDYQLPNTSLIEHRGVVGYEERAEIVGNAIALIQPTLNIEPFGGSVVEAQLYGTPVITTDWGAFAETVDPFFSGFRCRSLSEFVEAVNTVKFLKPNVIRESAIRTWSTQSVKHRWANYLAHTVGAEPGPPHPLSMATGP